MSREPRMYKDYAGCLIYLTRSGWPTPSPSRNPHLKPLFEPFLSFNNKTLRGSRYNIIYWIHDVNEYE